MKLEFDSVSDLQQFLNWAYRFASFSAPSAGSRTAATASCTEERPCTPCYLDQGVCADDDGPLPTIDTSGVAFDTPQAALEKVSAELPPEKEPAGKVPEQTAEPAKRKRRTRAEIEAAETVGITEEKAAEPAAQPEGPAFDDKGLNPFDRAAEAASPAAEPAGAEATEDTVVTPFQHLTRAREFIGKHGMPKYNESFAKAGLDPNVMAYTGYQRALHIDALDALEAA